MTMKENLKNDLELELSDLLRRYSKRKDFDAGKFTAALNHFSMRLTYEMTHNTIAATGLIAVCLNSVLSDLMDAQEKEIVFEADAKLDDELNIKKTKH